MAIRRARAILGFSMLFVAIALGSYTLRLYGKARLLDSHVRYSPSSPLCAFLNCPQSCEDQFLRSVDVPRVIAKDGSYILTVIVENLEQIACKGHIDIHAPRFEIEPKGPREIVIPPGKTIGMKWVIAPQKVGEFKVLVSYGLESMEIGILVTDVLGLNPLHTQIITWIGAILGPILTIPWWIERREKRKEKQASLQKASKGGRKNPLQK